MTEALAAAGPLAPYLLLVLVGFLPNEIWRSLGAVLSRGIDENAEVLVWVRAVATTLLAGVIAKLVLSPSGALAAVALEGRIGAVIAGLLAFFVFRRSVVAGVLAGEATLVAAAWWALAGKS